MMDPFDVTPTGMTQITYIPCVKDVSSLKPLYIQLKLDTSFMSSLKPLYIQFKLDTV